MTKKIKLLVFMPNLHGGGAEKVVVNMMTKLDQNKYDIHLVLVEKIGVYIELLPERIKVYDLKSQKTILSLFKLQKIIYDIKPDIIFTSLIRTAIVIHLALLFRNKKNFKIIYRSPNSPKSLLENNELGFLQKYLLKKAYLNANKIIAQTPEMKEEIFQYFSVPLDKIIVYLNPIDTEVIDKSLINVSNPFEKQYINVVAAGRLTYQKGYDTLILSFKKVLERNNQFRLYILGKGGSEIEEEFKNLVKINNLDNYIFFLGFQKNPYRYFYFSDLYVLSSRWEGLPNTILENLYLKKPIVATRCIPYMDTLIVDSKNGILVNVDDIDNLSSGILNYSKIDTSLTTIDFNKNSDLNKIFD